MMKQGLSSSYKSLDDLDVSVRVCDTGNNTIAYQRNFENHTNNKKNKKKSSQREHELKLKNGDGIRCCLYLLFMFVVALL